MYSISNEDKYKTMADNVIMREREVADYDLNISNYTALLTTLPQEDWPEHLAQYKNVPSLDLVPDEFDDIVNEYQFRDRIRSLLKTEKRERMKAHQLMTVLLTQLPADRKDALIAEAIDRRNAAIAAAAAAGG